VVLAIADVDLGHDPPAAGALAHHQREGLADQGGQGLAMLKAAHRELDDVAVDELDPLVVGTREQIIHGHQSLRFH
jgi:hypothetical protein